MANTFSKIYIHFVFAVKGRQNQIQKSWKDELYKYICGIVRNKKQKVYAVNGMHDHIHLLVSTEADCNPSNLMRDVKSNSTKWINSKKFLLGKFYWQEGFAAFSYSESQLDTIIAYINNQEKHHKKMTFKQEYLGFLKKFKIEYDERYVFEWIEDET